MSMETLTEITRAEGKRRERARLFESLSDSKITLDARVKTLKAQSFDVSVVEQIAALVDKVPAGILTAGRSSLGLSIPSGLSARAVLAQAVDACLADARRREGNRLADLKAAETELQKVERQLEAYDAD
jgi:hypothetical protein